MKCKLNRIIYPKKGESSSSGYTVAEYNVLEDDTELEVKKGDNFTATGNFLPSAIIEYDITGNWAMDKKYGKQFRVSEIHEIVPQTKSGIVSFLSSGLIRGIGERTAIRIVDKFGEDSLNIIENSPDSLVSIKGITQKKADAIFESYHEYKSTYSLVNFLSPLGVSSNKVLKIFKKFKDKALSIVKEHPFSLYRVQGFSFNTVCQIAEKTGATRNSGEACEAALIYALKINEANGDLYMRLQEWFDSAYKLLDCKDVTGSLLHNSAVSLMKQKLVKYTTEPKTGEKIVYLMSAAVAEYKTAKGIAKLLNNPLKNEFDVHEAVASYEKEKMFLLAPEQVMAVETALSNRISVITGGPGTGKTTIVDCIYHVYEQKYPDKSILMCAPTGCAARRIAESTGISAFTIHKVLGVAPNENEDDNEITSSAMLDIDLLIVDEFSMVDNYLASALMNSLYEKTQVVIIGDVDQLPSVGPGSVLSEIISSGAVPVSKLTKIYRQKNGSKIALNAAKIRDGDDNLEFDNKSFIFCEANTMEEAFTKVNELFIQAAMIEDVGEVTILSPFKRKTLVCSNEFNKAVQDKVNPPGRGKKEYVFNGITFRVGDKVLQNKNIDDVSNGDIGFISRIDNNKDVYVMFGNKEVLISDMNIIEHAYSMSVHKSQGSEYKTVITTILNVHKPMLWRNLLYTDVTRAKNRVVIVGQREALSAAIKNGNAQKRKTLLAFRITEAVKNSD